MSTPLYNARYTLLVRARVHPCVRVYTSEIRRARNSHRRRRPLGGALVRGGPRTSEREATSRCERRELPNWNVLFHLLFGKREMSSRAARRNREDAGGCGRANRLRHSNGFVRAREKESATSSLRKRLVAFIEKPSRARSQRGLCRWIARETRRTFRNFFFDNTCWKKNVFLMFYTKLLRSQLMQLYLWNW